MTTSTKDREMVRAAKLRAQVMLNDSRVVTLVYWPADFGGKYDSRGRKRHGSKPTGILRHTPEGDSTFITFEKEEIMMVWINHEDGTKEEVKWN